jgi:drug/metabolite transporter (DMT)-like permease
MQEQEANAKSKVEKNTQRDWIILAVLLGAGILTMPPGGDANTVSAGIAGVCFGAAAMLMVFRFGKKPPEDVK